MAKKPIRKTVPKTKKINDLTVQVKTQTTMKNTVNLLGSQILEILEKSGTIFDKDSKVTIKSSKKRYYERSKQVNINPKEMYEIVCTKKIVDVDSIEKQEIKEKEFDIVEI
jgi:hypothetical protein